MSLKNTYPPATRGCLIVWGLLAAYPFGGMVWQVLHHLAGLRRLGFDVWYVEDSDEPILTPQSWEYISGPDANYDDTLTLISGHMKSIGLADRWIFKPPCVKDTCYGVGDASRLEQLYKDADAAINLCGANKLRPLHTNIDCLIYLQTDPVAQQVAVAQGNSWVIDELDAYDHLFTYGENLGAPDCGVPIDRYIWEPTRPPVCLDWWSSYTTPTSGKFTTVGNWRNRGKDVIWQDEKYHWQKAPEFHRVINLPARVEPPIELALVGIDGDEQAEMRKHGWGITSAITLSDAAIYRDYILGSIGEFSVAKDQNIRLRSGWFSDRSACYLAAGHPVITQDTGFGNILPTGEGLFAFSNEDEAAGAFAEVTGDHMRHARRAREIAHEYFDAERVLGSVLQRIGLL